MSIAENVATIRARMNAAALAAGRDPKEILLCAATKMNDAERIKEAVAAGVDCCGENRVQELVQKKPLGAYTGKPLHFIGHLQTNKLNKVVGQVDLIQSVDRMELLEAVNRTALRLGLRQEILLEVNIGEEPQKGGFTAEESLALAGKMGEFPGVFLRGLMAIPPVSQKKGDNCKYFEKMRNLFIDIAAKKYDNVSMVCLSMGMSNDFEDAIAEGSTMIRIGTAIFGARPKPVPTELS
ncbi:MAG: YggS family pyridoxal phosphate-dependent enzyme [Oscillospiraceae bacterium]|nr:YggS family pyridoxal phosphate-dependent enzyme [Oscillospiraceae bacterium]